MANDSTTKQPRTEGTGDGKKFETEVLANERTFLAWVRTSIAVMSLGFVIARFSIWMRELTTGVNPQASAQQTGVSVPLGEVMIGLGALLTVFAAWRYRVVNHAIEAGYVKASPQLVFVVTAIVVGAAAAVIVYMTIASQHG